MAVWADSLSGTNPWAGLWWQNSWVGTDSNGGPGNGGYVSGVTLPAEGTYYVYVQRESSTVAGNYQVYVVWSVIFRWRRMRNTTTTRSAGRTGCRGEQSGVSWSATVAGTIMATDGSNTDEDLFQLGTLNAGELVQLDVRMPDILDARSGTSCEKLWWKHCRRDGDLGCRQSPGGFRSERWQLLRRGLFALEVAAGREDVPSHPLGDDMAGGGKLCESLGGHLVVINDQSEQDLLRSHSLSGWIGLSDASQEGNWVWSSGEPVSYTNWNSGEPNNSGNEDYAQMYGSGVWNDARDGQGYGIVEVPFGGLELPASVPGEPSTCWT